MLKKILPSVAALMLFVVSAFGQSDAGKLKGRITDETGAALEFATVKAIENGVVKGGANADENGEYSISPLTPGTYTLKATYAGNTVEIPNVNIISLKTNEVNITINQGIEMQTVVIKETIPIDQTTTGGTLTSDDVKQMGIRDVNSLAAIVPGVYQADAGKSLNMRGGRDNATTYYVDGVKVRGLTGLPQKAIGQLTVITGGTPAEYGDMIGGIISITTSSPSYQLTGGAEILTSQFIDPYGYNLFALNFSGPLISKRIDSLDYNKPIVGFFLATEVVLQKDQDPTSRPLYKVKDDVYDNLQANPLTLSEDGSFFLPRGLFLTENDVQTIKYKDNNKDARYRGTLRLDFQPSDNISIKVGATGERISNNSWSLANQLMAPEANQHFEGTLFRGWVRFQQTFPGDKDSKIKNLYYTLQADYNLYNRNFTDSRYGDDIFRYGYVGKFNYDLQEILVNTALLPEEFHNSSISTGDYYVTLGYGQNNMTFDATNSANPTMANYNKFILDYVNNNGIIDPVSGDRIYDLPNMGYLAFFGGMRNGDAVDQIYSLHSGPGSNQGGYSKTNYEQYRITGQASGEIKGHALKIGFEYEQRNERFYGVAARYLWTYMRQLSNRHLSGLDFSNAAGVYVDGIFQDTVHVPAAYSATDQSGFDAKLREALGLTVNGTDFINIDALDPSTFSLDMFTASELLNDGNYLVNYYGYDYTGKRVKRTSDETFFTDEVNRPMNSFAPTYISGFLQDKFELEDIIFNLGLRVDRFDANQSVLKDAFSLFPTYTAREAHELQGTTKPANIGDNWVPYTNNAQNPTSIIGYRDAENSIWYDANGSPTSASSLRQGGKVQPYLKDDKVSFASFKDYNPITIVMPRLSFSFPISGEAVFFAHYDVLAQRPGQLLASQGSLLAGQIADYYYLQNSATIDVSNSSLKPERTIDYEVGFKQKLNDFMAMSISAFYREMRDMIQIRSFQDAYPINYTSYDNVDFGTVKGFTFALNMIRMQNLKMSASYTLQFAGGTGSSASSARNTLNSVEGFSIIRTLLPLDFDQRHRISGNIDYRFYGNDRKGPGIKMGEKTFYPFANAGANATFYLGSGTPYSSNSAPDASAVMGGINGYNVLSGTPNGSRLPWQFRIDGKIDKDLVLGGGDKKDDAGNPMKDSNGNTMKRHEYSINIYVLMLNALNVKNVLGVYKTSGLADNDGYLTSGVGRQLTESQVNPDSFTYLYSIKMQNPGNYSLPRRVRLGLILSF